MNDPGVIDEFLAVFSTYIDSGFGLLGGEVAFLSTTLIVIDVTLAALFWAWGTDEDVLQRLVRKTLYIGVFAFIIGNFPMLARVMLESFAGLGLKASGDAMAIGDFMRPGLVAATGLDAAQPLLDATADLVGPVGLFVNFVQILILLFAWVLVVLAFFILAVQVFVTVLEFKLVTLAGFVLLPFAFFGRTAFMAEKVLGHVISSGIKVLVLAVITGIGTTLFERFVAAGLGPEPDIGQVMALALAALSLLGLGIFGPGIANGIVAGGPQLGAGAAAGTALAAGGVAAAGLGAGTLAAGAAAKGGGAAVLGGARGAGAVSASWARGSAGKSGAQAVGGGLGSVGRDAGAAMVSPLRRAAERIRGEFAAGRQGDGSPSPRKTKGPGWAARVQRGASSGPGLGSRATLASQTLKSGDSSGPGASPDLTEKD